MNIFEKRPLCLILCIGLGGLFVFASENQVLKTSLLAISILLGILSLVFRKSKEKRNILIMSSVALILSAIWAFLYFNLHFKAYEIYDDEIDIVGTVEEITPSSSYSIRLLVKVEKINNKLKGGYRFYAYTDKTDAKGIIEGTRISFKATLSGFSEESYSYNVSKGINAYAGDVNDLSILEQTDGSIRVRFARIREYLTRYTINLSNSESGAMLSALLLGERDYLPDQLRLDFKRIGISHILALSGMHLAILSLGIGKALSFFGVKKKTRLAVISAFVLLYMALTGFSVSVVRAGLMLIISSSMFLLSRSKDSLTSLSVAVFIICVIKPYAIMDISLWLSALATFGIIALGELKLTPKSKGKVSEWFNKYLLLPIMASIFAISSTMAVSTLSFGGFSLLGPITTIIFSVLAEIIMYLGCFMFLIGWLIPIGWLVVPVCSIMSFLAGAFSSLKFAYVSSNFIFVTVAVLIYTLAFYLFIILRLKKPNTVLNGLVVGFAILSLMPMIGSISASNKETVAYYSDYRCDELLVRSKGEVCLINSAQYSKNLAYTSIDLLEANNVTNLDKYYLTHYSWSLDDDIKTLMYNVTVDEIYIPAPRNEDEETILKILYKAVENSRTKVITFQEYETISVGEYTVNLLYSEPYGNSSKNGVVIAKGDEVYTYISAGLLSGKANDKYMNYISLSDFIILGDHGKKYKENIYIDGCFADMNAIVLHSDKIFLTQKSMKYYLDLGCDIYSHPKEIIYFKNE